MPSAVQAKPPGGQKRVALFVTCLVDLFRPSVGFAAVKLLEQAGFTVEVPEAQTCCGQPAYNSGDRADAQAIARNTIAAFEGYDYIVAPSGSCGGMLRCHYPELLAEDPQWAPRASALAARCYELTQFLVDIAQLDALDATFPSRVAYHDSCSSLREMNVKAQPRALLGKVKGVQISELAETEACCGFGGTFCVKFPDISNSMVERKTADIAASGADTVLAGDLGCLMNIAGKLKREGSNVKVRHVAEVLAGMTDDAAIGDAE
ncbi:(Fe-S)-binding protein [Dongia sedimenti]|uniref:(Fe-S)-binding protein n=1 Tax=Dongia sedimenti TaxID=3064282 RepID=A0ABU0YL13_9PROT|nr:(Fe-S)-binding protein [Rhodospirillaceae bacterium R-7]